MSHSVNLHSAVNIVAQVPGVGISIANGTSVPASGDVGYAPGCIYIKLDGSGESNVFYVNLGTRASASFSAIDLNASEAALLSGLTATAAEINRVAQRSGRVVTATASTLSVTEALHDNKLIVLDRAAGIAVTLPAAAAGLRFRFYVKTTFSGAASIKSVSGADIMVGHALMGNNSDNTVVDWPAVASNTYDTIDLFGTANSTGGIEGQEIEIVGLATNLWHVTMRGDAAGTEATPFADTVS